MKLAFLNFIILVSVLIAALFFSFATSLSTVSQEVPPPEKTERHLELEKLSGNAGFSRAEMDEFWAEKEEYQQRWKEKAGEVETPISLGFDMVLERMQIPFMVVITLFAVFFKWDSILDTIFILSGLLVFSFLFRFILAEALIYSIILVLSASVYKALHKKRLQ